MMINMLKSKLHNAAVTDANINYSGSIGIDKDLMEKAGLKEYEKVEIYNITNGERFSTYVMVEPRGSRAIVLNGASARKVQVGDKLIIAAFAWLDEAQAPGLRPVVVILNRNNDIAGP